jgi:hypothetical protein
VVHKSFAPKELVKVYEAGDAVVLPAWDPMVSRPLSLALSFTFCGLMTPPGCVGMSIFDLAAVYPSNVSVVAVIYPQAHVYHITKSYFLGCTYSIY